MIKDINELDFSKQYTYADYLTWWFEERVELIKGFVVKMTAPLDKHQRVAGNLFTDISVFLKKKPCQVRFAPYDVRLQRSIHDSEITTVVQPDICVICNPDIIDKRGCNGPPDMIIEVLSPSNSKRDVRDKFEVYEEALVGEYWIVDPHERLLDVFLIKDGKYQLFKKYVDDDIVPVHTLEGLSINMADVFDY